MKTIIARWALVGMFTLGASGAALANGDCGMNSNAPCPPPKSSAKEPANRNINSNTPAAQQATDDSARTDVQANGHGQPARATLTGVTAQDLKKPPAGDCGMNSNKPCADETAASAPERVQASDNGDTAARATLSGVNPNDLKVKPEVPKTSSKEPAANP